MHYTKKVLREHKRALIWRVKEIFRLSGISANPNVDSPLLAEVKRIFPSVVSAPPEELRQFLILDAIDTALEGRVLDS